MPVLRGDSLHERRHRAVGMHFEANAKSNTISNTQSHAHSYTAPNGNANIESDSQPDAVCAGLQQRRGMCVRNFL